MLLEVEFVRAKPQPQGLMPLPAGRAGLNIQYAQYTDYTDYTDYTIYMDYSAYTALYKLCTAYI